MRRDIKQRLGNIVSKPVLKYASEMWVLRSRDKQRLVAAHMTFMRTLYGVAKRDRLRNVDIRSELAELIL
jgi:hypothetical protein